MNRIVHRNGYIRRSRPSCVVVQYELVAKLEALVDEVLVRWKRMHMLQDILERCVKVKGKAPWYMRTSFQFGVVVSIDLEILKLELRKGTYRIFPTN